jgi:hypothetical protein
LSSSLVAAQEQERQKGRQGQTQEEENSAQKEVRYPSLVEAWHDGCSLFSAREQGVPTMHPDEPTLEQLIDEVAEARLRKALLQASSENILDRARTVSQSIEQRVRQLTAPARIRRKTGPNASYSSEQEAPKRRPGT